MADQRRKDINWTVCNADGNGQTFAGAQLAVLMDLRDELQGIRDQITSLNGLLHCPNFVGIPTVLRQIRKNTTKKRKAKAK